MDEDAGPDGGYETIAEFYVEQCRGTVEGDPVFGAVSRLVDDVSGRRVIDIACGEGRGSRALANSGADVVGVDISPTLLEIGRGREAAEPLGIDYRLGDAGGLDWFDGRLFDAAVCNHGFADISDLGAALDTVARVLRPGGIFVFSILHPCCPGAGPTTPSAWPPDRGYGSEGWWLADNPGMRGKVGSNFRTLSTYLNALIAKGFQLQEVAEPLSDEVPMFLVVASRKL